MNDARGFDFKKRLEKVYQMLETRGISGIILLNTRNIYWITGSAQASHLVIARGNDPVLLVRRNIDLAKEHSWFPAEWIQPLGSTKDTIERARGMIKDYKNVKVGMELNGLPASYYFTFEKGFGTSVTIENVSEDLRLLRMVKDEGEIEKVRTAAKVAEKTQDVVHKMLVEHFKPGTTERDVAAEVLRVAKKNRSEHFCLYDNNPFTNYNNFFIVTSGKALWEPSTFPVMSGTGFSPAVPYGPSDRELAPGDMVVCDYAVLVDGYHADHARSYVIDGHFPALYKERYANLKLAYERTLDHLATGMKTNVLYATMQDELERLGDPELGKGITKYFEGNGTFYQGLGHGIGLELDEPPFVVKNTETVLQPGTTMSLEPKIMVPGWGAINFEDNFVLRAAMKAERITRTGYLEW